MFSVETVLWLQQKSVWETWQTSAETAVKLMRWNSLPVKTCFTFTVQRKAQTVHGLHLWRRFFSIRSWRFSVCIFLGTLRICLLLIGSILLLSRSWIFVFGLGPLGIAVLQFVWDEIVKCNNAADERRYIDDQHLVIGSDVDCSHKWLKINIRQQIKHILDMNSEHNHQV